MLYTSSYVALGLAIITATCSALSPEAAPAAPASKIAARASATPSPVVATIFPRTDIEYESRNLVTSREQTPLQACPEQVGQPKKDCKACGGDSKIAGICNNILLSGSQRNCGSTGCGTYCQCIPTPGRIPSSDKQYVIGVCPEVLKQPMKRCSDCGGDSKEKGYCNNILVSGDQGSFCPPGGCGTYCQCIEVGPPATSKPADSHRTSLVSVSGATGTFTVTTLSAYKALQAATTVTTSESGKETALVIFAGGVAWWLAGQSGLAGAALAAPKGLPDGAKEDKKCPHPKEKCKDCGGGDSMHICKSGADIGCPCDEEKQECPKDLLKCTDKQCGGDDGHSRCKADGKTQGCQCCPEQPPDCSSKDCNGKDDKCQTDKFKGCVCAEMIKCNYLLLQDIRAGIHDLAFIQKVGAGIAKEFFGGDLSKLPGLDKPKDTKPWCIHGASPHGDKLPREYCQCGNNYATTYSVISSTTSPYNPCPYSKAPGDTLVFSNAPAATKTGTTAAPATTKTATTTKAASSSPEALNPTPAKPAKCFATHDSNNLKRLVQGAIKNFCSGKSSPYTYVPNADTSIPQNGNSIYSGFTIAKDAPDKCKELLKKGDPADDMFKLCSIPVTQILDNCPHNGGSVDNVCGTWFLQTCVLGRACKVGDPST